MIVEALAQAPGVVTSENVMVGLGSQLSLAIAGPPVSAGRELSSHSIVKSPGAIITGASVS